MSLVIDLTAEEEARIRREAALRRQHPEDYARALLTGDWHHGEPPTLDVDEFDAILDSVSEGLDPAGAPLSDEAVRRASFYRDLG